MRIAAVFIACLHALHPSRALAAPHAAGAPTPAAGPVAQAEAAPLDVQITVALDPAYDAELADALRVVVTDAAAAMGGAVVEPGDGTGRPSVAVAVRWYEGTAGDIRVEYVVGGGPAADGSKPAPKSFVRRCETCDAAMLVEKVRAEIGRVLRDLEPPPPAVEPAPIPIARPPAPRRVPLSAMGWAGVGLSLVAVLPLSAGIPLTLRGKQEVGRDTIRIEYKNYRPAGLALIGSAAGLVVTGVILVAVDRARARRGLRRAEGGATAQRGRSR